MKTGSKFAVLVGARWMRMPFLLAFLGRLPLYMTSVALVLWTGVAGGSALLGGFYVAMLNVGVAVGAPWLGHLADRRGRPLALRSTGVVQLVVLGALYLQEPSQVAVNAVLCLVAGLSTPPISSALRSMVTDRAQGGERDAAFTGEAMVGASFAMVGPLALSGFILLGGVQSALLAGAVLAGGGALALSFLPAMRAVDRGPEPVAGTSRGGALAPLQRRGFRTLTVRMLVEAVAGGVEQVAVPSFALSLGSAALTGPMWAIASGVGLAAGAVYAVRTWRMPKETIYCIGVTGLAVSYVVPAFATSFTTMVLALCVGAVLAVPVTATEYDLVARTVPETQHNSGFAIMTSAAICGTAIGAQAGGFVIFYSDYRHAFAFAAVLAGAAAVMSWFSRQLWAEPPGNRGQLATAEPPNTAGIRKPATPDAAER